MPNQRTLLELERRLARVNETELAMWMFASELAVSLHRGATIGADIGHRDAIEEATIVRATRFECFDDEPLIGMRLADVAPLHRPTLTRSCDSDQLLGGGG